MINFHRNFYSAIFIGSLFVSQSFAFRLDPMTADFTPEGDGASRIFRVENESTEKIAVKIQAFSRLIDENGKETNVETKDFKIYPEQISLTPSDSRAIRLQYIGDTHVTQEMAYRVVASQLPVAFKKETKKTGINFLFQFVASVYVTSDKFIPKIEIESVARDSKERLVIKVINKGQKHALLKNVKVDLTDSKGKIIRLGGSLIETWENENILSGTRRTFKIKSPLSFDLKKYPARIEVLDEI